MAATTPPLATILARLQDVRGPDAQGWHTTRCIFHADGGRPNLRVNETGFRCMRCGESGSLGVLAERLGLAGGDDFEARIDAIYDYRDERGALLYQCVRLRSPKDFRQRQPDGPGRWTWNLKGVRRVLYRLPELLASDRAEIVFVPEGEKDVDRLRSIGLVATCNPMGAGKWHQDFNQYLRGRRVVAIEDNDEEGRKHTAAVSRFLSAVSAQVGVLRLPGLPAKGDVSDWLDAGGTREQLLALATGLLATAGSVSEPDGRARPEIIANTRHLHEVSEAAWNALLAANVPPKLFRYSNSIAEVRLQDSGRPEIVQLGAAAVRGRLDRSARWLRETRHGLKPVPPPDDVVGDVMALEKPLPPLKGIVGTPVFSAAGELVLSEGYQVETGLYYWPDGPAIAPVPEQPDETDLRRAKEVIGIEWLSDFPFVDEASRAHALAAVLTVVARELIDGPTPLFAFDAPAAGTGKGLLASTCAQIVTGRTPYLMTETRSDEELRKRITAVLATGSPLAVLDNVRHRVESGVLAALLTATAWRDRVLGRTELLDLPNRTVWALTGNNVQLSDEILRRTVWIRLDARADRPWDRNSFRHADLTGWVARHRHEIVWAFLVLTQNWVAKSRPACSTRPLGSFESWCSVVGGILEAAHIGGFLANREELYRRLDTETEEWRSFTQRWWDANGAAAVKTSDLQPLALTSLPLLFQRAPAESSDRALRTRLGKALSDRRDRRFGPYFIRHAGEDSHSGGALWRLESAEGAAIDLSPSAHLPQLFEPATDSVAERAEHAEPVSASRAGNFLARENNATELTSGNLLPHVPHVPRSDSEARSQGAEGVQNLPLTSAEVQQKGEACHCGDEIDSFAADGSPRCWKHREVEARL